jgi:hypothetical protein
MKPVSNKNSQTSKVDQSLRLTLTVDQGAYFKSQFELAKYLNQDSRFSVIIYFTLRYPGDDLHHLLVKNFDIEFFLPQQSSPVPQKTFLIPNFVLTFVNTWRKYYSAKREWVRHIAFARPAVVILPAENRYLQNLHSNLCRRFGVPVVVAPLWVAGKEELIEASIGTHSTPKKILLESIIAVVAPKYSHRRDHDSRIILATSWDEIICQLLFRCAPKSPWILHDGSATVIAVESTKMFELAIASGIRPEKMTITGSIFHDRMFAISKFAAETVPVTSRQSSIRILVAIPPDMFYVREAKGLEYFNYEQLINHWIVFLESLKDVKITYCLHPSSPQNSMFYSKGIQPRTDPIEDLIPSHDLFIASISATIQWALAAGLKVVDFDVYRYCYPNYASEKEVRTCLSIDEFEAAVKRVVDSLKLGEPKTLKRDWGILDGLAGNRIKNLLVNLVKAY